MINFYEKDSYAGKVLVVNNGIIEFTVTKDIGPRIIAFNKLNQPNILYQDINLKRKKDVSDVFGQGKYWYNYGGHRLWLSPEDQETYYPDNAPVDIQRQDEGVLITAPLWQKINVVPSIKVEFQGTNTLKITHIVQNKGQIRELCLWGLTVMKSGGKMELALSEKNTNLLPNRNIVLWPYTDFKDERLEIYNNKLVIKSNEKETKPLKIGAYSQSIKVKYTLGTNVFMKEFSGDNQGKYPDYHCNFESYTCDVIHEIESLSPMKTVESNGIISFTEYWTLV